MYLNGLSDLPPFHMRASDDDLFALTVDYMIVLKGIINDSQPVYHALFSVTLLGVLSTSF